MSEHILVVEDDPKTADLLRLYLERERYAVQVEVDGQAGIEAAFATEPDLIVLDIMLPVIDGIDVCRAVRERSEVPIIMVTARGTEADTLLGLSSGADDYITKPFRPRELVARVQAVLRRTAARIPEGDPLLRIDNLEVDIGAHEARLDGAPIALTPREFRLLETLARSPGRAFSRHQLMQEAFGYEYDGLDRTIDAHIANLRRKIEPDPSNFRYIQTVYGVGYRATGGADGSA